MDHFGQNTGFIFTFLFSRTDVWMNATDCNAIDQLPVCHEVKSLSFCPLSVISHHLKEFLRGFKNRKGCIKPVNNAGFI